MSPTEIAADPAGETTRGRPRDADRTAAILDAAVDVMHDVGWDGFRVQEVATRAGAGLATIYRRWPTKEDLVAAAMRHDIDGALLAGIDASDDPAATLAELLAELGEKMCGKGGSVISVLAAARDHEVMREAFHDVIHTAVRGGVTHLVGEVLGAEHPQVLTLTDSILGALIFRAGMLEIETPGSEYAAEMMALIAAVAAD
ncbi:MAG: helix-turn-helix domain-containing protein [Actinomycetota bacterium]